jgi:hypothetical protein
MRTVFANDLEKLTQLQAEQLQGKWARFLVALDSLPLEWEGAYVFECQSSNDSTRTVWLPEEVEVETLTVGANRGTTNAY